SGRAVHLGRAGTAFAGLTVPANREIVGLFGLDLVNDIEHYHSRGDNCGVVHQLPPLPIAAPDPEHGSTAGLALGLRRLILLNFPGFGEVGLHRFAGNYTRTSHRRSRMRDPSLRSG